MQYLHRIACTPVGIFIAIVSIYRHRHRHRHRHKRRHLHTLLQRIYLLTWFSPGPSTLESIYWYVQYYVALSHERANTDVNQNFVKLINDCERFSTVRTEKYNIQYGNCIFVKSEND